MRELQAEDPDLGPLMEWLASVTRSNSHRPPTSWDSSFWRQEICHDIIYFLHNSAFKASKELRERLGVDDIALILQQNRMRWYGHVLRKDDDDWVKKCMEYEAEGSRPRGRPKRTWKEVVREDCQARKLNKEDAVDRCKWWKVIKEVR